MSGFESSFSTDCSRHRPPAVMAGLAAGGAPRGPPEPRAEVSPGLASPGRGQLHSPTLDNPLAPVSGELEGLPVAAAQPPSGAGVGRGGPCLERVCCLLSLAVRRSALRQALHDP